MSLKSKLLSVGGPKLAARIMGVLFASTAAVVVVNEGYKEVAYQDSGGVWTICYGETKGVEPGQKRTRAECDAQLRVSINEHAKALTGLPEGLPDAVVIGSLDGAYNIGVNGFKASGMYTALLLRDYAGAKKAMLQYRFISKYGSKSPGPGWNRTVRPDRWVYDCSQLINGKRNKVCWGLWERRQWQAAAVGNEFKSAEEAVAALPR